LHQRAFIHPVVLVPACSPIRPRPAAPNFYHDPPGENCPAGFHLNLAGGIQQARYRQGYGWPRFLEPGEVYEITIQLGPTSNRFLPGHRRRVDVSSSNVPRCDVNSTTGAPVGRHAGTAVAHHTIYLDAGRPSHIILPIVPSTEA
jgi:putative CocE/NonD family hydrolase